MREWSTNAPKCENCGKMGHLAEKCWPKGKGKEIREVTWKERIKVATEQEKVEIAALMGFQTSQ